MNYLAHLYLTDGTGLPLSGAVLGDHVRGRLEGRFAPGLERSLRLHRHIDVVTDSHPLVAAARAEFGPGARRYGGIVLDLVYDHLLARDWSQYSAEPLQQFVARAADAVADDESWRQGTGESGPSAWRLRRLLLSNLEESGIDRALQRTAARMKQAQPLLDAGKDWRKRMPGLALSLPMLLSDLRQAAQVFAPSPLTGRGQGEE
jgi:acyl carrier protein phosphodiesterase